ncbi:snoRNA-binding rRNA-processing protein UTP15 [Lachancea thermotolerans CBS 6340]|uniref:KLTH0D05346p n=1 Tax=Lachancea thermotolerans (strain ATCC 56472 / CBS 6340 / NRRL Y-8284) TaxID=559295 RepID=C5DGH4_LACTC|nr:KLTH0D05346p [Lachancea thermotolerans CBS 6340]CAR22516.1 KLTH0D05346p [Lachancea thermotolerans CBS 6340]
MSSSRPRATLVRAPVLPEQTTPEQRYWRSYGSTQLVKEHNSVTSISFNPTHPNDFAITSSTRVQLFSSRTRQVIKTFSRFKDVVYSASFRQDGKLLAMGDATGRVSIYDSYNPRTQLVSIAASSHPTHVAKFHPADSRTLVTASDDRVVRVWDITQAQEPQVELTGAADYVRSVCMVPQAPHLVVTGSYDGFVRLFDTRSNEAATTLVQGMPVEDVIAVSPTQLVSCGGPKFKVWDLTAQRQLLERVNFAKTVTCLDHVELMEDSPMSSTLVASSLDGHVKVFDPLDGYKVKFGWKFSSPVLSCAVSPGNAQGNKHLVAGLSSGLLAIRTKRRAEKSEKIDIEKVAKSSNFQRMMRGSEYAGDQEHIIHNDKTRPQRKLRAFERHMNQFKWAEALDAAFVSGMAKELTLTALHELRRRGKIRVALIGRDESSLEPLLNWCLRGIEDVRSATVVADWVAVVLELYGDLIAKSSVLEEMIVALKDKVKQEVHRAEEAQKIEGMLQLLVS